MMELKWLEDKEEKPGTVDTYMDTYEPSKNENTRKQLILWWARQDLNLRPDDYESSQSTYIDYYYLLLIIIIYSIFNVL